MKIVDYVIVIGMTVHDLGIRIHDFLKEPTWQPFGNVGFDGNIYFQTMVKYEEEESVFNDELVYEYVAQSTGPHHIAGLKANKGDTFKVYVTSGSDKRKI